MRRPDGRIDVARIAAVAPAVATASASVARTTKSVAALPHHTWLKSVDAAYADALTQVTSLDETLRSANLAVKILSLIHI